MVRLAGREKRRSWGENQSRVIFADGKKSAQENQSRVIFADGKKQPSMPGQENQVEVVDQGEGRGRKVEDSIQLRKDVEELRRRKQQLREQFGENEKVLAEVESRLATVGRQGEIARFKDQSPTNTTTM